jgi:hypothetical protein
MLLEVLLQAIGVLEHGRQGFRTQRDDDGPPVFSRERNDVLGDVPSVRRFVHNRFARCLVTDRGVLPCCECSPV